MKILLIEDNPQDAELIRDKLADADAKEFHLSHVARLSEGLNDLAEECFDVVLLDLGLPDSEWPESLTRLQDAAPSVPIIVLTGLKDEGADLEAIQLGAQDFIPKADLSSKNIARSIRYAVERKRTEKQLLDTTDQLQAIAQAMTALLESGHWKEASFRLLSSALSQTGSEYGFVGVVVEGPVLRILAHEGIIWHDRINREFYEKALHTYEEVGYLEFTNFENLFGKVITTGKPVLSNEPGSDSSSGGLPAGHPPLRHFLGVPCFRGAEVVGLIGVANRPGGYTGDQQTKIRILTSAAGVIYESYRREQEVAKLSIERKQGDEALKASQASFHNVVERTDDGIVVVDPDGMILYVNRSAVFLLGRPAGELVGSRFGFPLVAGEVTEFDVLPLKQEPRIAEMRVVKTEWDGVPAFLASLRDITERKRDEETIRETNLRLTDALDRLKETQEQVIQQERLRALGEMASGIAHDFNNALSPVVGYSELLLISDKNLEDKEKLKGFLSLINTAGQDASKVVSRLREFYRCREDNEILLPTLLNQLVEQAVALTRPRWKNLAQARGADIQIETELGDIPPIAGNESELREMLTNLIFNAVDAMPDGGAITIATRLEEGKVEDFGTGEWKTMGEEGTSSRRSPVFGLKSPVSGRSENAGLAIRPTTRPDAADSSNIQSSIVNIQSHESHVVLEVSDTGSGMTEDVRRKCLEPFFSTKGNEGTGLGLAMVFGIIDRHDGKIEIQSELGSSTTLIIRLPIQTEKTEVGQPDSEIAVSRSLHVLIVDDEEPVLDILSEFLTMDGHTVESANNGREGLEKFHTGRFDLVVTDRAMPEMSGDQLAATIKSMAPDKPIIMLTGFGDMMKASEENPPGVDYILSKPTKMAEFRKAIWTVERIANPLGKSRIGNPPCDEEGS